MPFKERYFNIWKTVWDLHRKFDGTSVNDDNRWNSLLDEAKKLKQQFENSTEASFARDLILATCSEIERSSKNATKKQTQHTAEQP